MLCYFSLRPMRRHPTSSCYSMKLPAIMRCVYWVGVRTAGSFITIITKKKTKEPNDRVLLGALLFGCVVSFGVCNLCLDTYRRNHKARFDCLTDTTLSVFFSYFQDVRFQRSAIHMCRTPKWQHCGVFLW